MIERELSGRAEILHARDMEDAVCLALQAAQPGDCVLLSPACASFDMFESYAHRGRAFAAAVVGLEL
jgi:UDP-N-acetylmuramoylalanine--D-glutamate ligase